MMTIAVDRLRLPSLADLWSGSSASSVPSLAAPERPGAESELGARLASTVVVDAPTVSLPDASSRHAQLATSFAPTAPTLVAGMVAPYPAGLLQLASLGSGGTSPVADNSSNRNKATGIARQIAEQINTPNGHRIVVQLDKRRDLGDPQRRLLGRTYVFTKVGNDVRLLGSVSSTSQPTHTSGSYNTDTYGPAYIPSGYYQISRTSESDPVLGDKYRFAQPGSGDSVHSYRDSNWDGCLNGSEDDALHPRWADSLLFHAVNQIYVDPQGDRFQITSTGCQGIDYRQYDDFQRWIDGGVGSRFSYYLARND